MTSLQLHYDVPLLCTSACITALQYSCLVGRDTGSKSLKMAFMS